MRLIAFVSKDCEVCKKVIPVINSVCLEHEVPVLISYVENHDGLFEQYGITGTPMYVLEGESSEIARCSGHQSQTTFQAWLEKQGIGNEKRDRLVKVYGE